jgi:6-phosphogluconolactonase
LFPHSPDLARALDAAAAPACVATYAPVKPAERISLNMAALLDSRLILLMIAGDDKWQVYQRALQGADPTEMPVRAVLRQQRVPVEVYWSA